MRTGIVVMTALGTALTATAGVPEVVVTCVADGCTIDRPPPPGSFRVVVRVSDPKTPVPHLDARAGAGRALARCPKSKVEFCGTATAAELDTLWFGRREVVVALTIPKSHSFNDISSAVATGELYQLDAMHFEAFEVRGEGTPALPQVYAEPPITGGVPVVGGEGTGKIGTKEVPGAPGTASVPAVRYAPLPLDDESYPDLVALGNGALDCSGVAVAQRWILTARHCGAATRAVVASDVSRPVFEAAIDRVVDPPDPRLDLELLHTARDLPVTPHLRRRADEHDPPDSDMRVVGFGISNFASRSGFGIKRAFETVGEGWGCDGTRPRTTGCDPARELVIPATSGHDTCNGDSGGAVFELDENDQDWRLVAITSRAASVLDSGCGMGGIYVRLDMAATWIDDVVKGQQ